MDRFYVYETRSIPRWVVAAVPPERLPELRLWGDFSCLDAALSFKVERARWHPNPEPGIRRSWHTQARDVRGLIPRRTTRGPVV